MARPIEKAPIGAIFSRLTVIGDAEPRIRKCGRKAATWQVNCACGKVFSVVANSLKRGLTQSCGCLNNENAAALGRTKRTHGESDHTGAVEASPEYRAWKAMKQRCLYPNHIAFSSYGGAGISICDEWTNSFEAFLRDMRRKPSSAHSLDRIDGTKGYSPENCKWSTKAEQARNRKNVILNASKAEGIRNLSAETGWGNKRIAKHLNLPLGAVSGALYSNTWKAE